MERKILLFIVLPLFFLYSCTPAYVKRLERIETLLDNLEKEIKITKTSPELAVIHTNINAFSMEIKKISSLDYSENGKYAENSSRLSDIISKIESIHNEFKKIESENLDNELKETFLDVSKKVISFAEKLKDRDLAISKGETAYKNAETSMIAANAALKDGRQEDAEKKLKEGKASLNIGNNEFIKAAELNNSLLNQREDLIQNYQRLSSLVKDKMGLELFEISDFKFLEKDKKRLDRTVNNLRKRG
ncbi:MAG: hypothetical protein D6734_05845 [Candidatus Schekmanbacteria bacterium]|nr:MAG: hypothetical protein D6734_05845 [Candidatus Schekmanbacteria bacterium]